MFRLGCLLKEDSSVDMKEAADSGASLASVLQLVERAGKRNRSERVEL
jgi:hypothetical protein